MSSERERATYYREHKDDPDMWGEGETFEAPRRRKALSATITVRFSPEEADAIRRIAQSAGQSYSDVVREAVKAYTQPFFQFEVGQQRRGFIQHDYSRSTTRVGEEVRVAGDLQTAPAPVRTCSLSALDIHGPSGHHRA